MRKKLAKYILQTLAVLSFIELVFNAPILFSPHDRTIRWFMPESACENDNGVCCVVDNNWTQLTVLNPDKTIISSISAKFSSTTAPDCISDIALDDAYVYILDKVKSKNGTSIESERVLKYEIDGSFVSTVYTDHETDRDFQGNIRNIRIFDGNLYVLKAHGESATVFRISEGVEKEIMHCSFPGSPIQFASYQPEMNTLTASTMNGRFFVLKGEICEEVKLSDRSSLVTDIVIMPDGSRYVLDCKNGRLVRQYADLSEIVICRTDASRLCHNAPSGTIRHIYLCDDSDNTVTSVSIPEHEQDIVSSAEHPLSYLVKWYLTLCSLIVLALALIHYLSIVLVGSIKHRTPVRKLEKRLQENGVISPAALYGKPALFIILSFLVTGLMLSGSAYHITMDYAVSNTDNIAASISSISSDTIGDAVRWLDSAGKYESSEYKTVCNFCQAFCTGRKNAGFDLLFDLVRIDPDTGALSYVFDHTAVNVLGTTISKKRISNYGLDSSINSVIHGEDQSYRFRTDSGHGFYAAISPIFDSSRKVTGFIIVINDLDAISEHSKEAILTILLRAFSLLSIVIMLFVELKLTHEFLKIRKKRFAVTGNETTICEGHRELRIVTRLPFYLLAPFIAPYAKQLAMQSGMSGEPGMLAALPLSIYGLVMAAGSVFMSIFTKRDPGRSINTASIVTLAVAGILLFNHLYLKSFYLLVFAYALLGIVAAVTIAACKAIRLYDLKPDNKYKKLVFTNMEPPIYASVGAALGSLVYDSLGFAAVIGVLALTCVVAIVLSKLFIASDINISKPEEKTVAKDYRKMNIRYFLRIDVIGFLLLVAIPAGFLMQYTSFMLPMFNESLGNTILVVGSLTLMTKLLPIPLSPNIIMSLKGKTTSTSAIISLSALALSFFAFALQPTMTSFALVLFVLGLFHPVFLTLTEKFQIDSAKTSGIIPSNVNGIFAMALCVGDFAGPICLAAMMAVGDSAIGVISGAFCILCIVGVLLTFRKR